MKLIEKTEREDLKGKNKIYFKEKIDKRQYKRK